MTAKGRKFWDSLQPKIYEFYRQAMEGFRFDDKVALVHFLNRLNEGMRAVSVDNAFRASEAADADVGTREGPARSLRT